MKTLCDVRTNFDYVNIDIVLIYDALPVSVDVNVTKTRRT